MSYEEIRPGTGACTRGSPHEPKMSVFGGWKRGGGRFEVPGRGDFTGKDVCDCTYPLTVGNSIDHLAEPRYRVMLCVIANATRLAVESIPNFFTIRVLYVLTVLTLIPSSPAISFVDFPRATRRYTARSRSDST